jgi:hypothetical protein
MFPHYIDRSAGDLNRTLLTMRLLTINTIRHPEAHRQF